MPPGLSSPQSSPCWLTAMRRAPPMAASSRRLGSRIQVGSPSLPPRPKSAKVTGTGRWCKLRGTGTRSSGAKAVMVSPATSTSAFRKCSSAQRAATAQASPRLPSSSSARTSTRMLQTLWPPTMHRASASTALLPRRSRSMKLATAVAWAEGRPASNPGEAIGPNSTWKAMRPSFGRSGGGVMISPLHTASARVGPRFTSASPWAAPKRTPNRLYAGRARPSIRTFSARRA
mmetsp:Transcript_68040/g.210490  ORF Transcript_68040/g.210490 Transcript_68040/m.210490 type:complete len:231 (+) Transcript_68040:226-918(+)